MDHPRLTPIQILQVEQEQQERYTQVTQAEIALDKARKAWTLTLRLHTDDMAEKAALHRAAHNRLQALLVPGADECRLPQKSTTVVRLAPDPLSLRHTLCFKGGKGGQKSKGGKAPK